MKPAPFQYELPKTEIELEEILSNQTFEGQILAGGQSLIPSLNTRQMKPKSIVDINKIDTFNYLNITTKEVLIGPLIRHETIYRSEEIQKCCPMLSKASGLIGHRSIRNRGTTVGSVAQGDPQAEIPTVMTALQGIVVVRDSLIKRELIYEADTFFQQKYIKPLPSYHYIKEIRVPKIKKGEGHSFVEFSLRQNDAPQASVGIKVKVNSMEEIIKTNGAVAGLKPYPTYFKTEEVLCTKKDSITDLAYTIIKKISSQQKFEDFVFFDKSLLGSLLVNAFQEAYEHAIKSLREEDDHVTNQDT